MGRTSICGKASRVARATVKVVLRVAYDGSAFAGFQRQPQAKTVQGTLEAAASQILGHPVGPVRAPAHTVTVDDRRALEAAIRALPAARFA